MTTLTDYLDRMSKPDENGLLPCEQCGGNGFLHYSIDWPEAECRSCGVKKSLLSWNRRPWVAALRKATEWLYGAMDEYVSNPHDSKNKVDAAIPKYVLVGAGVRDNREWRRKKRIEARRALEALKILRLGCAYFPHGSTRIEAAVMAVELILKEELAEPRKKP